MKTKSRIVAHRGYSARYPENTLAAFCAACDLGVDDVELDVRRTKDGRIVVLHDAALDRTTDGRGAVAEFTERELFRFSAGGWFSPEFNEERIPFLTEAFDCVRGRTELLIEIKETGIEETVVALIREHEMQKQVSCISFDQTAILTVRDLDRNIPVCFLTASCDGWTPAALAARGIRGVNIEFHCLSEGLTDTLHSFGLTVNAWTVDEESDMERLQNMGVDAITTNDPAKLKRLQADGR